MLSNKSAIRTSILSIFIPVLLIGCFGAPKSISSKYEILSEKPDGFALSRRILLVADNQLNHLYGDPVWLRNELFDKVVNVTIRPVQQDLFGQDILKWILRYYGTKKWTVIVHLGDGTNMACAGEFRSFEEIMNTAGRPWFMAPGNHDAYMLGNLHNTSQDWWNNACTRAEGPLTKDRFVSGYLKHLAVQHPGLKKYLETNPNKGEWKNPESTRTFLRFVAWKIDKDRPYSSFVIQELDVSRGDSDFPIHCILMDSTQYSNAPSLAPIPGVSYNAGLSGSFLSDQAAIAKMLLGDDPSGEKMTILMVHHPYDKLIKSARETIDGFRNNHSIPLYASGHTHHGEYFVRGGDNGWLELNVGSTVDWPIEFRTLQVYKIKDDPSNLVFRTPLFRIPDIWDFMLPPKRPQPNAEEWEIKETDAKDFYLAHNYHSRASPEKTQRALLVAMLHTYERLLVAVESADDNTVWPKNCSSDQDILDKINGILRNKNINEMTSFLIALHDFEKKRKPKYPQVHRDYRLYQAVWASKYDKIKSRKPVTSDTYIRFPRGDM